jgi:hypothetical protein
MRSSIARFRARAVAAVCGVLLAASSGHAANVGYYEMCFGSGQPSQIAPIVTAGHTPVLMNNLTAIDLLGIDVLFVTNCDNFGYGAEYLSNLASIQAAVAAGMALVIHDRFVDGAESILPGGAGFTIVRDFGDPANIDVLDPTTLVTNGPGGMVTNLTLDGGNSSSHGFAAAATLPGSARLILSRSNPAELVTFSYQFGAGAVLYSTIPLDFYLDNASPGFATVYAPNVVAYAATQIQTTQCPAGACDDGVACTFDICLSSAGGVFVCSHFANDGACNDGNPCTDDICDSASGCFSANDDTNGCSDNDFCTAADHCVAGACVPGSAFPCNDFNPCTDDFCSSVSGCFTLPHVGGPCNDSNPCTSDDACGNFGNCTGTPNLDPCNDGNACTVDEHCQFGFCAFGATRDCDDHNSCTTDSCSPSFGCLHAPLSGMRCQDSNPCTTDDVCMAGTCTGEPRNCLDDDPCTVDTCNSAGGAFLCQHEDCADVPDSVCPAQCVPVGCGNHHIDPGETCDPPDPTPKPGHPGEVTCRPDCTSCGDAITQPSDGETCDDGNFVTGCNPQRPTQPLDACQTSCTPPICQDPARIRVVNGVGVLDVHGRIEPVAPALAIDPSDKTFVVELTDATGAVVFRTSLEAGAIIARGRGFKYVDRSARTNGGISRLKVAPRGTSYRVTLTAYGDLTKATSEMTTHLYVGAHEWTLRGHWLTTKSGWKLDPRSALGAP